MGLLAFLGLALLLAPHQASAQGCEDITISSDTLWTLDSDLVCEAQNTVSITSGAKLTIHSDAPLILSKLRFDVVASELTFSGSEVTLSDNDYAGGGGAISTIGPCRVTFEEDVSFLQNSGGNAGGAILCGADYAGEYDSDQATILSFRGQANFQGNTATAGAGYGGALLLESATASFSGPVMFDQNLADIQGGAVSLDGSATEAGAGGQVLFVESVSFVHNRVEYGSGGALSVTGGFEVKTEKEAYLEGNSAGTGGAVACVGPAQLTFASEVAFVDNEAFRTRGGGLLVENGGVVVMEDSSSFEENVAQIEGGGVTVTGGSSVTFQGVAGFKSNRLLDETTETTSATTAPILGAAMYFEDSSSGGAVLFSAGVCGVHSSDLDFEGLATEPTVALDEDCPVKETERAAPPATEAPTEAPDADTETGLAANGANSSFSSSSSSSSRVMVTAVSLVLTFVCLSR